MSITLHVESLWCVYSLRLQVQYHCHLPQLLSTDSLHLFSQALRNLYHLIEGNRKILKLQLEVRLDYSVVLYMYINYAKQSKIVKKKNLELLGVCCYFIEGARY